MKSLLKLISEIKFVNKITNEMVADFISDIWDNTHLPQWDNFIEFFRTLQEKYGYYTWLGDLDDSDDQYWHEWVSTLDINTLGNLYGELLNWKKQNNAGTV